MANQLKMAQVETVLALYGATELLRRARLVGPQTDRWAETMLKTRGVEGVRPLVGLLALVREHSAGAIERVCGLAAGRGVFKLRALRELLKRRAERTSSCSRPK